MDGKFSLIHLGVTPVYSIGETFRERAIRAVDSQINARTSIWKRLKKII
jgi:hypothetical protein